jgi:hypothetical protein
VDFFWMKAAAMYAMLLVKRLAPLITHMVRPTGKPYAANQQASRQRTEKQMASNREALSDATACTDELAAAVKTSTQLQVSRVTEHPQLSMIMCMLTVLASGSVLAARSVMEAHLLTSKQQVEHARLCLAVLWAQLQMQEDNSMIGKQSSYNFHLHHAAHSQQHMACGNWSCNDSLSYCPCDSVPACHTQVVLHMT